MICRKNRQNGQRDVRVFNPGWYEVRKSGEACGDEERIGTGESSSRPDRGRAALRGGLWDVLRTCSLVNDVRPRNERVKVWVNGRG